jgi:hypothetical protein
MDRFLTMLDSALAAAPRSFTYGGPLAAVPRVLSMTGETISLMVLVCLLVCLLTMMASAPVLAVPALHSSTQGHGRALAVVKSAHVRLMTEPVASLS